MGHLYYDEFGLPSVCCRSDSDLDLHGFSNLIALWYWSGTLYAPYPVNAWVFGFGGGQDYGDIGYLGYGLALRSGQVVRGSIPTLSEWGQILLVVMLGVSVFLMKRRRTMNV